MQGDGDRASLFAALAAFQAEVRNPAFDAVGHHKNGYATLQQHLQTIRPVLSKHGLSLIQLISTLDQRIVVRTVLAHANGGWIGSEAAVPMGDDIQKMAGKITYLRRYMVAAITGVAGDQDDDGEPTKDPAVSDGTRKGSRDGRARKAEKPADSAPSGMERFKVLRVEQRETKAGKAFWRAHLLDAMAVEMLASTFSSTVGERLSASVGTEALMLLEGKEANGTQFWNIREMV
jgi:hypothetical protein